MKQSNPLKEEKYTLDELAGSYETRSEQEEAIWRAFVDTFAKNHALSDLFTWDEILYAYHMFLHTIIAMEGAALSKA